MATGVSTAAAPHKPAKNLLPLRCRHTCTMVEHVEHHLIRLTTESQLNGLCSGAVFQGVLYQVG